MRSVKIKSNGRMESLISLAEGKRFFTCVPTTVTVTVTVSIALNLLKT